MIRSYKYRIYPNREQVKIIGKTIDCCRLVYNLALQARITAYKDAGIKLSSFDLCYQLSEMKKEYTWMYEVDSQALQCSVKNVDFAFKNFFNGKGYPKFKNKKGTQSFKCPGNRKEIDFKNELLSIAKIKNIPIVVSRVFSGKIKSVTISRVPSGKYFASLTIDNEQPLPIKNIVSEQTSIGIDLGIKTFAVLSSGRNFENPKYLKNKLAKLKYLQRKVSRKKIGSKNRTKANYKVVCLHEKISNQRMDFLHKFSDTITKWYDTVCVENLNVAGMIKNHKLSQSISDVGWSTALQFIKYKSDWRGKNYIEIGRFEPSSTTHNECGFVNSLLSISDREWLCPRCNEIVLRDYNAALNIRDIGLSLYSGWGISGEPVELPTLVGAMKQELHN